MADNLSDPGPHLLIMSAVLLKTDPPKPGLSLNPRPHPPTFNCFPFPLLNLDFRNQELYKQRKINKKILNTHKNWTPLQGIQEQITSYAHLLLKHHWLITKDKCKKNNLPEVRDPSNFSALPDLRLPNS